MTRPRTPTSWSDVKRYVLRSLEQRYWRALYRATRGNISEMARIARTERAHVRTFLRAHKIGTRAAKKTATR